MRLFLPLLFFLFSCLPHRACTVGWGLIFARADCVRCHGQTLFYFTSLSRPVQHTRSVDGLIHQHPNLTHTHTRAHTSAHRTQGSSDDEALSLLTNTDVHTCADTRTHTRTPRTVVTTSYSCKHYPAAQDQTGRQTGSQAG